MNNQFQQQMSLIRQNNERKRLAELQSKYQTAPDYTNMSLRDELNTRYEIGEMNQLQQKYPPENNEYTLTNNAANNISSPNISNRIFPSSITTPQDLVVSLPQIPTAAGVMASEYFKMKNHGFQNLDDYHHCKANFNASRFGAAGDLTAQILGYGKEIADYYRNQWQKGLSQETAQKDMTHDLSVNKIGRDKARNKTWQNAVDACAEYRPDSKSFPQKYW